jgi:cysteinyl-tRNA synthetase
MALLSAHYRAPLDWTENGLQQARRRLDGLYQALRDAPGPERPLTAEDVSPAFLEALEDDLNTPRALAELSAIARAINSSSSSDAKTRQMTASLLSSGALLGLLQTDPETWFAGSARRMDVAEIERLIQQRTAARSARDFATADRIREDLGAMGILIEDGAEGTRWRSVE